MEFDLLKKIELHGNAIKNEILFSNARLLLVILVVAIILRGDLNPMLIMLIFIYGAFILHSSLKKVNKYKMLYKFVPGNPTYDQLSDYGDPYGILDEISGQARNGVIYSALGAPNKAGPETLITAEWFVHLNKRATVIPLEKIVCAYIFDNVAKETPDKRLTPTRFKPLYFVITYGEGKEAVFMYNSLDYERVLAVLDEKLRCRVIYTREMGMLYKTDYEAFLAKVAEAKAACH